MLVYNFLVQNTYLMIGMNKSQTSQGFRLTDITRKIQVYRVENPIISNTARNYIITFFLLSNTA